MKGDDEAGGISICSSDDGEEEGIFKTPSARTPRRDSSDLETRGRHPKDPTAKAAKKEIKLQGQIRSLKLQKEKERFRLQEGED